MEHEILYPCHLIHPDHPHHERVVKVLSPFECEDGKRMFSRVQVPINVSFRPDPKANKFIVGGRNSYAAAQFATKLRQCIVGLAKHNAITD